MKSTKAINEKMKTYLREVKLELKREKISSSLIHVIMKKIKRNLVRCVEEESDSDLIEFNDMFGTPENIARDYINSENFDVFKKAAKRYFILKFIFAVVMVVVAVAIYILVRAIITNGETTDIEDPGYQAISQTFYKSIY